MLKNLFYFISDYSFLNSSLKISDLVVFAQNQKWTSVGLCDTNPFGFLPFYQLAKKAKINPVFGLHLKNNLSDFIVYAKNNQGFKNLNHIYQLFLSVPKFSLNVVLQNFSNYFSKSDNMVIIFFDHNYDDLIKNFFTRFDLYFHFSMYEAFKLPISLEKVLIWTAHPELSPTHQLGREVLKAISQKAEGKISLADIQNLKFSDNSNLNFVLAPSQYDAVTQNTFEFLNRVKINLNQDLKLNKITSAVSLDDICQTNLKKHFQAKKILEKYEKRLKKELTIINSFNFASYFLIVADYVQYARDNQITIGIGRGSANSSLVAFLLGITAVDPLEYNLLFERFLNQARPTLPDIDVDFESDRRHEIINYLQTKYGMNKVCQITTYSNFTFRTALRELCYVIDISVEEKDQLLASVTTLNKTISDLENFHFSLALKNKYVISWQKKSVFHANILKIVNLLINLKQKQSIHASGVIISDIDLNQYVPLWKASNNLTVAGADMHSFANFGFVKFDILVLTTLSFINQIVKKINVQLPLNKRAFFPVTTNYNDKIVFQLLQNNLVTGIFQLDSVGMRECFQKVLPNQIEHITAALSLYRPGAWAYINLYSKRKFANELNIWGNKIIDDILNETYGIILYQEQIMLLLQKLLHFSLEEANAFIKSISKGKKSDLLAFNELFFKKIEKNLLPKELLNKFYHDLVLFFNYGFNKAHATGYALLVYQMLYLKAVHPKAFFAKLLSNASHDNSMLQTIAKELRHSFFNFDLKRFHLLRSKWEPSFVNNICYLGYSKLNFISYDDYLLLQKIISKNKFHFNDFVDLIKFKNNLTKSFNYDIGLGFLKLLNENHAFFLDENQALKLCISCKISNNEKIKFEVNKRSYKTIYNELEKEFTTSRLKDQLLILSEAITSKIARYFN